MASWERLACPFPTLERVGPATSLGGGYPRRFGLHPPGAQRYLVSIEATAAVAAGCSHARHGKLGITFALHGVKVLKTGFGPCGSMGGFFGT